MAVDLLRTPARVVGVACTSIALYYALWGGEYSAFDLGRIAELQLSERQRLAETQAEVDSLRLVVEQLESDPAAIESFARERFGMIREGETLYRFVQVEPTETPLAGATARP
jgi:cell division protein FtsB